MPQFKQTLNPRRAVQIAFLTVMSVLLAGTANAKPRVELKWKEVNEGVGVIWEPRAGLQAVNHRGRFYVLGGRAPKMAPLAFGDSIFFNDVWKSGNAGKDWSRISNGNGAPWAARAYFQAVTKGPYMYVIGGQDSAAFPNPDPTCGGMLPPGVPCPEWILGSEFFNDVWRSRDGVSWEQMTNDADWSERAGLSAVTHRGWIYVMGGSVNDDTAIIGPGGPPRIYYNDVYRTRDGRHWQKMTEEAPWAPRAGAVVVSRGAYMYMLGGEDGFVCNPFTPRCPPYFNDVWKSKDGRHWTQVTEAAGWSPRPGHQCEVLFGRFYCFGGFGLSEDPTMPFKPSNPVDIWASYNGADWTQLSGSASPPWNAAGPEDIKYDFAAFPVYWVNGRFRPSIFTFGGDRETFDPTDFLGFQKVDNDVWQLALRWRWWWR
ncbi:MAG: hypothetical protein ACR2QT_13165 [Woeseiaceae bacterium]